MPVPPLTKLHNGVVWKFLSTPAGIVTNYIYVAWWLALT